MYQFNLAYSLGVRHDYAMLFKYGADGQSLDDRFASP